MDRYRASALWVDLTSGRVTVEEIPDCLNACKNMITNMDVPTAVDNSQTMRI
ncbi:MAG: hypothetical protein ACM3RP_07540 [Chitinophagales bacterium]